MPFIRTKQKWQRTLDVRQEVYLVLRLTYLLQFYSVIWNSLISLVTRLMTEWPGLVSLLKRSIISFPVCSNLFRSHISSVISSNYQEILPGNKMHWRECDYSFAFVELFLHPNILFHVVVLNETQRNIYGCILKQPQKSQKDKLRLWCCTKTCILTR